MKAFFSLPPPERGAALLRSVRSVATRAVASATAPPAGPVHLNFPFREPLIPARASPEDQSTGDMGGGAPELPPVQHAAQRPVPEEVVALADALAPRPRGIIVCGPQRDPEFPGAVARLAARLNYPILADPLSLVRCGRHDRHHVIDCYDAVLRDPDMATSLAPQAVLRFGGTPASRPLLEFLAAGHDAGDGAPVQVLVAESGRLERPHVQRNHGLPGRPSRLLRGAHCRSGTGGPTARRRRRRRLERHLARRRCGGVRVDRRADRGGARAVGGPA